MKRLLTIHTAILVVTLILAVARVDAGTVLVPGMSGGALIVSNVTSLKEARYRSTIHQKYVEKYFGAGSTVNLSEGD